MIYVSQDDFETTGQRIKNIGKTVKSSKKKGLIPRSNFLKD
jgi:hypothetical protein